jgi:hypothetical protein
MSSLYIIFIALAKNVQMNGNEIVTNWPLNISSKTKARQDKKNSTQYMPVDFFDVSILKNFCENKTKRSGSKTYELWEVSQLGR